VVRAIFRWLYARHIRGRGPRTVAECRIAYPEAVAEIKRAEAAKAERERILGIDKLAVPGCETLIAAMKRDGTPLAEAADRIGAERAKMATNVVSLDRWRVCSNVRIA